MKLLLLMSFFASNELLAKDITEYECELTPEHKVELTLIDPKLPSMIIKNKKTNITRCFYQSLTTPKPLKKPQVSTSTSWYLQLLKCDIYNEKLAKKFSFSDTASFKQAQKVGISYFRLFKDQNPLLCRPKLRP